MRVFSQPHLIYTYQHKHLSIINGFIILKSKSQLKTLHCTDRHKASHGEIRYKLFTDVLFNYYYWLCSTAQGEGKEEGERRRETETYWLTSPPSVIEFLSPSKTEAGIKHWVIH